MKNNPVYLEIYLLIAIILVGLGLYCHPLQSTSFYFDDRTSIVNNETIKTMDPQKILKAFNTRSLVGLSFAINYHWCGLHPFGFRLTNLLIHCFNAFLVYVLIKSILGGNIRPAVFGAFLFLCHPIQTEAVNSITQRFVLMGTFFYLGALILYIKSRRHGEVEKFYYICSLIAAMAAIFCKEFVVTLPFMLILYDFYFLRALAEPWWKRCRRILPFFVIMLIVPILLLRTPREAIGVANIADNRGQRPILFESKNGNNRALSPIIDITRAKRGIGRKQYFLTELNVVRTYVRLLFLPINQNFDYDYPLSRKLDLRTLFSGAFLLCLLALAAVTYRSYRIVSFSILWFFIALSVESSFIPIGHVIAEYRLYLASVGFVFLITFLIYSRRKDQRQLNLIAAAILIGCSILTYQRNKIWENEFSLWDDTIKKSPHKATGYLNRGLEYYGQGKFAEAVSDFNKTIELNPDSAEAYNDLGVLYALKGSLTQALSDFNKAIELKPDYADAYKNRDLAYHQLKENEK